MKYPLSLAQLKLIEQVANQRIGWIYIYGGESIIAAALVRRGLGLCIGFDRFKLTDKGRETAHFFGLINHDAEAGQTNTENPWLRLRLSLSPAQLKLIKRAASSNEKIRLCGGGEHQAAKVLQKRQFGSRISFDMFELTDKGREAAKLLERGLDKARDGKSSGTCSSQSRGPLAHSR